MGCWNSHTGAERGLVRDGSPPLFPHLPDLFLQLLHHIKPAGIARFPFAQGLSVFGDRWEVLEFVQVPLAALQNDRNHHRRAGLVVGQGRVQKTSAIVEEKIDTAADATALSRFRLGGCTPSLPKSKFPIIFRKDGP